MYRVRRTCTTPGEQLSEEVQSYTADPSELLERRGADKLVVGMTILNGGRSIIKFNQETSHSSHSLFLFWLIHRCLKIKYGCQPMVTVQSTKKTPPTFIGYSIIL